MALTKADQLLSMLDSSILKNLSEVLNCNENWLLVINVLGIYSSVEVTRFKMQELPGRALLNDLETKLCPVECLVMVLRHCKLFEALLLLTEPEPLKIICQPTDCLPTNENHTQVKMGCNLELTFIVEGLPPPKYTWMKDNNAIEPAQNDVTLIIENFSPEDEGDYWCIAKQETSKSCQEVISNMITAEMIPIPCKITLQPPAKYYHNTLDPVILKCTAIGHPLPTFQWYHNGSAISGEVNEEFKISKPNVLYNGDYRCKVKNIVNKSSSVITTLKIIPPRKPLSKKIAILIANQHYNHLPHLQTPINDVETLAEELKSFHFQVFCLMNLSLKAMKHFLRCFSADIDPESYVIVYYAGHGFEYGDKYLVPVDSHCAENRCMESIPEKHILQLMLEKKPKLVVTILDMCLQIPSVTEDTYLENNIPGQYKFTPDRNLIQVYTTSPQLCSYERKGKYNGVYVQNLKPKLRFNLPIKDILEETKREMSMERFDVVEKQIPYLGSTITEEFFFNDPVISNPLTRFKHLLPIYIKKCKFQTCEKTFHMTLRSYKDCFNNTWHLIIDKNIRVALNGMENCGKIIKFVDGESKNLIIQNIQNLSKPYMLHLEYQNEMKTIKL